MIKPIYVLWSSVEKVAGCFMLMYESMELSGRRYILMLKKQDIIHKNIVESKYGSKTQQFVDEKMARWILLAYDMYNITDICHSQGKVDKTKLFVLKTHITFFVENWFPFVNYKNPIFWKLHMLICGLISYTEKYQMIGCLNE